MTKKVQDSLEERAKNYGNEIKQISDFVEQVRQTPDVFIGKVKENAAFLTMTREIFQNSIDDSFIIQKSIVRIFFFFMGGFIFDKIILKSRHFFLSENR